MAAKFIYYFSSTSFVAEKYSSTENVQFDNSVGEPSNMPGFVILSEGVAVLLYVIYGYTACAYVRAYCTCY